MVLPKQRDGDEDFAWGGHKRKARKFRVCIVCVKTVDGEFPAYRELLKFNKLRVISATDSSDSPRLHQVFWECCIGMPAR